MIHVIVVTIIIIQYYHDYYYYYLYFKDYIFYVEEILLLIPFPIICSIVDYYDYLQIHLCGNIYVWIRQEIWGKDWLQMPNKSQCKENRKKRRACWSNGTPKGACSLSPPFLIIVWHGTFKECLKSFYIPSFFCIC